MKLSIPWFDRNRVKPGRIGLAVGPDGLAAAHLDDSGIRYCCFHSWPDDNNQLLAELTADNDWHAMPCSVVLHPVYYQLSLTEKPPVQPDEMPSAVRWQVKEFLDFPLDEAAIEYFLLPDDAYRGRQKMLYAAALRKKALQDLVEPVQNSGLEVDCIEIAELALNNVVCRLPAVNGAAALVQLYEGGGFINLIEDGSIYLCRRLDIGLERFTGNTDNSDCYEMLLLEIQRSLDFYESQLGKGIVTTLYYSPGTSQFNLLGEFLSNQLGLNVLPLSLPSLLLNGDGSEETNADEQALICINAIGAALGPLSCSEVVSAAS